jgi:hypothetical protein
MLLLIRRLLNSCTRKHYAILLLSAASIAAAALHLPANTPAAIAATKHTTGAYLRPIKLLFQQLNLPLLSLLLLLLP